MSNADDYDRILFKTPREIEQPQISRFIVSLIDWGTHAVHFTDQLTMDELH